MSKFRYFLKRKGNKIGALTFLGLGLGFYVGFYLAIEILSGWTYFRSDVLSIWSFLITLVCYLFLFITNIRNDNAAYTGVFIFISLIVLEGIFNIVDIIRLGTSVLYDGHPGVLISFIAYCVLLAAIVVIGILFYITVYRYMFGRHNDFKRILVFASLFVGVLGLSIAALMAFYGCSMVLTSPNSILLALSVPVSELLVAIGVIFTLKRLRRI